MNAEPLYQVLQQLVNNLPMSVKLRRVLRDFSLGMLVSGSCKLERIAQALRPLGKDENQYRRLQRFLDNDHLDLPAIWTAWTRQVVRQMQSDEVLLLVDETALSKHVKVMVLGIWTQDGCVPVAWRSSQSSAYPACGQVQMIVGLLQSVIAGIPIPTKVRLLADRGIGTSPELVRAVEGYCHVLFRVQGSTRFRDAEGNTVALRDLGIKGQCWQAVGDVFKKADWLPAHVMVAWGQEYEQPWCLVSSEPLSPATYARRFDQEVSFRDLKSDGFGWHTSHVWLPDHLDRLLLVLALDYWLILAVGQQVPPPTTGRGARWSAFRRGWEAIASFFRPTIALFLPNPSPPFMSCVVQ